MNDSGAIESVSRRASLKALPYEREYQEGEEERGVVLVILVILPLLMLQVESLLSNPYHWHCNARVVGVEQEEQVGMVA